MNEQKEKKQNKYLPNQSMLAIRVVLGGYLVYLAYDIISLEMLTVLRIEVILLAMLFGVAGLILVIITLRSFIKGEYIGGKADITEEEDEQEIMQPVIDNSTDDNNINRMP
jgi:hypothetical protein